jgi:hypothetical protein
VRDRIIWPKVGFERTIRYAGITVFD